MSDSGLFDGVPKTLFDANTILKADVDNIPTALVVAASKVLGRSAAGSIAALTAAEVKTLLAIAIADISDIPGTIATILTDHNKVAHDALDINAATLDGLDSLDFIKKDGSVAMTGDLNLNEYKIGNLGNSGICAYDEFNVYGTCGTIPDLIFNCCPGIDVYQYLRPSGDNSLKLGYDAPQRRWSDIYAVLTHFGDIGFAERECPKCGKNFLVGDNLVLKAIRIDEETNDIMTIPIHLECINLPRKIIKKKYAVKEDFFIWNEEKNEIVKRKRNKVMKNKAKKNRIKSDFILDEITGNFYKLKKQLKNGFSYNQKLDKYFKSNKGETSKGEATELVREKVTLDEAIEEVVVEIYEVIYEEREFEI